MKFEKIDFDNWERASLFRHFIDNLRCVMSMTAEIDVTELVASVKRNGLKFYPTMMWIVSKVVNAHDEFKFGRDAQGNVGIWENVFPYYADFHAEDETCVKLIAPYSENFKEFHRRFLADRARFAGLSAFAFDEVPPNTFDVSCLPWVSYRSFDLHVFDEGTYLAPIVTWGKYEPRGDRIVMPLSMNLHHAVADGFHLSRFFIEVGRLCADFGDGRRGSVDE